MFRAFLIVAAIAFPARAEDWPGFRGPTGMGQSAATDLPLHWGGKDGENVRWKVPLPGTDEKAAPDRNQSSPIVRAGRVYVTVSYWPAGRKQTEFPDHRVACYRLDDGKLLWDVPVPPGPLKLTDLRGGYTAPTPCADAERLYVVFGSAKLAALDFEGKILWQRELPDAKDFDVAVASSPVVFDGRLYLLADRNNKKSTLTAFDPKTGEPVWTQKRASGFSHTTPVFAKHDGNWRMFVAGSNELAALDPATGERVWWVKTPGDVTAPVYADGHVYIDSGRGGPGVYVDAGGAGDVTKTHVKWTLKTIPEAMSSPVILAGHLCRVHSPGILMCVDVKTSEVRYKERLTGVSVDASPFSAGDRVYCASAGKTFVVKGGPAFEVLATNDLGDPSQASAAVADGRIILKGTKTLFCIGTK
jgi:outer membrane protein assembly factor BamB